VEMSALGDSADREAQAELLAVAQAAGARLRAETEEGWDAARSASEALMQAATSAMAAGYSLSDIARAEARGQDDVRRDLSADALQRVKRTGIQARDAELEHHQAIARAMRLGLSTREIAGAAGVTHGTIRAIGIRLSSRASNEDASPQPREADE
jgi:hypothetical protein